jgi:hypothetical protein
MVQDQRARVEALERLSPRAYLCCSLVLSSAARHGSHGVVDMQENFRIMKKLRIPLVKGARPAPERTKVRHLRIIVVTRAV